MMIHGLKLWTIGTLAVSLAAMGCQPAPAAAPGKAHRSVGKKLPALALQGLTGKSEAKQLGDLNGKITVLHFWGTWCPPCVKEFPAVDKLQADYGDHARFLLLPISSGEELDIDLAELRDTTEQFLTRQKSELANYADVNDKTRTAVERTCGWAGYPCTVVLQDDTIRGVWLDLSNNTAEQIDALVKELLGK
ncbi:MAG: TlpA family protein disulfide reductase [Pirellulales bacterium]